MALPTSPGDPGIVCVSYANVQHVFSRDSGAVARALPLLRPAERERYDRFRQDADRQMFLLGRVMARALVGNALGVAPHDWLWREGLRGRPEVDAADCPISFNLAHSAGMVVCAISWGGPVGVDVEHRARTPLEHGLIERCCAPDEAADIEAYAPDWGDRFLQYWTLKESYLKATGLGISVHLPDVRFRIEDTPRPAFTGGQAGADTSWVFDLSTINPAHYVAVAMSTHVAPHPTACHQPFPEAWWP
jgi:4'-phosphopantetheinyl transferase